MTGYVTTDDQLRIKGVLFAHVRVGSKETHQTVSVSDNTSGFYLLESTLKDLELLPTHFPTPTSRQNVTTSANRKVQCECPQRMAAPPKPAATHPTEKKQKAPTGVMDTGAFWSQHTQHVPSSDTTDDKSETSKHHLYPANKTDSSPHADPSSS